MPDASARWWRSAAAGFPPPIRRGSPACARASPGACGCRVRRLQQRGLRGRASSLTKPIDRKIAADFLIVEIDLHDLGSRQVVDRPLTPVGGVIVGEPRADADDQIRFAARASGADEARAAKRADRERMILRQHALGGQRRGGRDVELLGRRLQRVGRAGAHHAPPASSNGRSASAISRAMRSTFWASARGRLACGARAPGASISPSTMASWIS